MFQGTSRSRSRSRSISRSPDVDDRDYKAESDKEASDNGGDNEPKNHRLDSRSASSPDRGRTGRREERNSYDNRQESHRLEHLRCQVPTLYYVWYCLLSEPYALFAYPLTRLLFQLKGTVEKTTTAAGWIFSGLRILITVPHHDLQRGKRSGHPNRSSMWLTQKSRSTFSVETTTNCPNLLLACTTWTRCWSKWSLQQILFVFSVKPRLQNLWCITSLRTELWGLAWTRSLIRCLSKEAPAIFSDLPNRSVLRL